MNRDKEPLHKPIVTIWTRSTTCLLPLEQVEQVGAPWMMQQSALCIFDARKPVFELRTVSQRNHYSRNTTTSAKVRTKKKKASFPNYAHSELCVANFCGPGKKVSPRWKPASVAGALERTSIFHAFPSWKLICATGTATAFVQGACGGERWNSVEQQS